MKKRIFGFVVVTLAVIITVPPILQAIFILREYGNLPQSGIGPMFYFWLWSVAPFALYYLFARKKIYQWGNLKFRQKVGLVLFPLTAIGIPALHSIYWVFDIGNYSSGSSTSALAFVFIPLYALVLSLVPILLMASREEKE